MMRLVGEREEEEEEDDDEELRFDILILILILSLGLSLSLILILILIMCVFSPRYRGATTELHCTALLVLASSLYSEDRSEQLLESKTYRRRESCVKHGNIQTSVVRKAAMCRPNGSVEVRGAR
jgi:hypothetical protein